MASSAYSTKKLRKALLNVGVTGQPVDLTPFAAPVADNAMADYLVGKIYGYGQSKAGDAAAALDIGQKQEEDRERTGLTKTFDWLGSLGLGVQNIISDVHEGVTGEDSLGQTLKDIGNDLGGAAAAFTQPVAELAMIPGIELPGIEKAYNDTVGNYIEDNNVTHHGDGRMSGSRLLEDFGWEPDSTLGKVGKAITGFGVDVLTDPLTYASGGILPAIKGLGKAGKVADDLIDAGGDVSKLVKGGEEVADVANRSGSSTLSAITGRRSSTPINPVQMAADRSIEIAPIANKGLENFNVQVKNLSDNFTPAAAARRVPQVKKSMNDELKAFGLDPTERNAVAALARTKYVDSSDFAKLPFEQYADDVHNALKTDIKSGMYSPKLATSLTKVMDDVLSDAGEAYNVAKNLGANPGKNKLQRVLDDAISDDKVDSMLARTTTWGGRGPEYHTYRNGLDYAEKLAKTKAKWFRDISTNFTKEQQLDAWKQMTGRMAVGAVDGRQALEAITDPAQRDLAMKMFDYMDWTFGHKSAWTAKGENALDGVTALKSGLTMEDIDRQLKAIGSPISFAKLNKGKKGQEHEWLSAITDIDPQEAFGKSPASLMLDLDRAFTRTQMNYAMVDDFVGRMSGTNQFTYTAKINHPRIPADARFEPKVAKEFSRLLSELDKAPWSPQSKLGRAYFTGLRHWKSGVTIYNPSHHVRNSVGDAWLMWMDGVSNPRVFRDAQKLMWAHRANYKGALKVDEFGNPPELDRVMGLINRNDYSAMSSTPGSVIIDRRGVNLNADDIYRAADERGLFATADQLEDIVGPSAFVEEGSKRGLPKPLGGKGHDAAAKVSEYREHYFRSAHFIDVVRKGITPSVAARYKAANGLEAKRKVMDQIYDDAARRVRKWHPDGRDLTQMEQKFGKGLIPFYSWQRKSIPLFIQAMVENPQNLSKMSAIPRANFALQEALGIESAGPSDQFPVDEIFPDWIRAGGMGPIGDVTMGGLPGIIGSLGRQGVDNSGNQYGFTVVNPGNPFQDFIKDFGGLEENRSIPGTLKSVVDQSSPLFQWAAAASSGDKTTGAPISTAEGGQGWGEYTMSQIPIASTLQRFFDIGREDKEGVENGPANTQALLNWLTGAGIIGTGQYNKSAEFDQRDYLRRMAEQ